VAEPLALACTLEVDSGEDHGEFRRLEFDAVASGDARYLEGAGLESLDPGITKPSFLWRYTNSA
jgi:hypothetical protein